MTTLLENQIKNVFVSLFQKLLVNKIKTSLATPNTVTTAEKEKIIKYFGYIDK